MIEFNLLPWRERRRARTRRNFLRLVVAVVLGSASLLCGGNQLWRQSLAVQQLRNEALQQQLVVLEPALTQLRILRARGTELMQQIATLQALDEQRAQDARLLDALARTLPEAAYYTVLAREDAMLHVDGMATGMELMALLRALEASPLLAAPRLREIAAPQAGAPDRKPFMLSVPLRAAQEDAP
jgi:type IV pilus assembly protein PilN